MSNKNDFKNMVSRDAEIVRSGVERAINKIMQRIGRLKEVQMEEILSEKQSNQVSEAIELLEGWRAGLEEILKGWEKGVQFPELYGRLITTEELDDIRALAYSQGREVGEASFESERRKYHKIIANLRQDIENGNRKK